MSEITARELRDRLYAAVKDVKSKKRNLRRYLARHGSERTEPRTKVYEDSITRAETEMENLKAQVVAWK